MRTAIGCGSAQNALHYLPPINTSHPAMTAKQLRWMEHRTELFQQHGFDAERASRWADYLAHTRDAEKDDRRLCVECRHLLSQMRCAKGGPVLADTLQRCASFDWEKPKS